MIILNYFIVDLREQLQLARKCNNNLGVPPTSVVATTTPQQQTDLILTGQDNDLEIMDLVSVDSESDSTSSSSSNSSSTSSSSKSSSSSSSSSSPSPSHSPSPKSMNSGILENNCGDTTAQQCFYEVEENGCNGDDCYDRYHYPLSILPEELPPIQSSLELSTSMFPSPWPKSSAIPMEQSQVQQSSQPSQPSQPQEEQELIDLYANNHGMAEE